MKEKILIIDDDEMILLAFSKYLEKQGYKVKTKTNFKDFQNIIEKEDFDLIVTDIYLGTEKSGIDILREINEKKPFIPVILLTGCPNLENTTKGIKENAFDYLIKPLTVQDLLKSVKNALKFKTLRDEKENYRVLLDTMFQNIDEGIIIFNNYNEIISANNSILKILNIESIKELEKTNKTFSFLHELILETSECNTPVKNRRIKFQDKLLSISSSIMKNESMDFSGYILILNDISVISNLQNQLNKLTSYMNIIGGNNEMQKIYFYMEKLAGTRTNVLITGETGTGKELIAKILHNNTDKNSPFVCVNCSALSESLLESELFGHVKGAFTGAISNRIGRFESADHGTVFLDEIADISFNVQKKLIRFLQEREFERVGDTHTIHVDVRIIAATNKDLKKLVEEGKFREDLYYRLKIFEIKLPPLKERKDDLELLVHHFINKKNKMNFKNVEDLSWQCWEALKAHSWPGNIRELEHVIEHAVVLCSDTTILIDHLPAEFRVKEIEKTTSKTDLTRENILNVLKQTNWRRKEAAEILEVSRQTLYRKMKEFNIIKSM